MTENQGPATVRASVDLSHRQLDGQAHYALPATAGIGGPCDGLPDGTPCGYGCTCHGGQPWYNADAVSDLGFTLDT